MNKWHQNTLNHIFSTPVPTTLEWRRIEALFRALGARSIEGRGSRVRFEAIAIAAEVSGKSINQWAADTFADVLRTNRQ